MGNQIWIFPVMGHQWVEKRSLIWKSNPTFHIEFDFFGEHLMNTVGALLVPEQWLGTTAVTYRCTYNTVTHHIFCRYKDEFRGLSEEERSAIGVENQKFLRDFDAEASQMEFHHLPQKPGKMEFHLVIFRV